MVKIHETDRLKMIEMLTQSKPQILAGIRLRCAHIHMFCQSLTIPSEDFTNDLNWGRLNTFAPMKREMYAEQTGVSPKESDEADVLLDEGQTHVLIVWNDDVNTFDWVIETLVEVCNHTYEQAEQCAMIIHSKGKYGVKQGDYETLKPMCDAICERLINATIEELVN
jgi:ATP-dependent Clp protease adaptor protein ClpS